MCRDSPGQAALNGVHDLQQSSATAADAPRSNVGTKIGITFRRPLVHQHCQTTPPARSERRREDATRQGGSTSAPSLATRDSGSQAGASLDTPRRRKPATERLPWDPIHRDRSREAVEGVRPRGGTGRSVRSRMSRSSYISSLICEHSEPPGVIQAGLSTPRLTNGSPPSRMNPVPSCGPILSRVTPVQDPRLHP